MPSNPYPSSALISLSSLGPVQRLATPQFYGTTYIGVAALTLGKTVDLLVARATSTAEHIAQAVCIITYLRSAQQPNVASPSQSAGHPATALIKDYTANGFLVEVSP